MAAAAVLATTAAVAAWPALRARMLDFGSTADERRRDLPGDELLPDADLVATRAITIAAPPEAVWPWLVQIGTGRAGACSYDWLDRLIGLDMHSSRRIVPELQDLDISDVIPVANDGSGLRVHRLEAPGILGTRTDDDEWAWTWILRPTAEGTRLLSRARVCRRELSLLARVGVELGLIPASFVMERKMLQGLRERVEGHAPSG